MPMLISNGGQSRDYTNLNRARLCTYPNVKPEGGGGGGGRATHGNLTVAYIRTVGILVGHRAVDLSILYSGREVNHLFLLILTILFCPGVGILIIFFRKCQNPHPMPDTPPPPPPLGLDTDRCIINIVFRLVILNYLSRRSVYFETDFPVRRAKIVLTFTFRPKFPEFLGKW